LLGPGEFDLAGFAVGIVEEDRILDGRSVAAGDVLVGLLSPGLRSNGYSLARSALLGAAGRRLDEAAWPGATRSLGEELLEPSVIYAPAVMALLAALGPSVHAVAHITGGGLEANLPRVLPAGFGAVVRRGSWPVPPIFGEVQRAGQVSDDEMARVFNLGLGMVAVVAADRVAEATSLLTRSGVGVAVIGEVVAGQHVVTVA
jgi:phosphoribosylformylglycinamidine cyclo-ligase